MTSWYSVAVQLKFQFTIRNKEDEALKNTYRRNNLQLGFPISTEYKDNLLFARYLFQARSHLLELVLVGCLFHRRRNNCFSEFSTSAIFNFYLLLLFFSLLQFDLNEEFVQKRQPNQWCIAHSVS